LPKKVANSIKKGAKQLATEQDCGLVPRDPESEQRKILSVRQMAERTKRMESQELGYQVVKGPLPTV
jgi:hypothetical protein